MWFLISFLLANFIGLTAFFAALVLWRRESRYSLGWLVSRRGLGTLCVLAAGAGLVVGAQFKLVRWFPRWFPLPPEDLSFLSLRAAAFLVACLVLMAIGAALSVLGGPAGGSRAAHGKGPFVWSVAVALTITLAELSIFQYYNFEHNYKHNELWNITQSLPTLELDTKGIRPDKTYKKGYQFSSGTENYFPPNIPIWEKALEGYKGKPNVHYLEVGIFEGQSALWMLEKVLTHPTARLTGIDPFSDPGYLEGSKTHTYKEIFYSNLKASGSEGKARIIEGYSQVELRKLPLESFDIIYIDGSHNSADALEDAILSWRLLKDGGVLIFDDYLLHAGMKRTINTFFSLLAEHFELVHVGRQVLLKKKPTGGRIVARSVALTDPGLRRSVQPDARTNCKVGCNR